MVGEHAKFSPRKTSSNRNCCVPQCSSVERRNSELRFHTFPPDGEFVFLTSKLDIREKCDRRKSWIKVLKIGKPVTKSMFVCSRHFLRSDYVLPDMPARHRYLKKTAVPSMNLPITACDAEREKAMRFRRRPKKYPHTEALEGSASCDAVFRDEQEGEQMSVSDAEAAADDNVNDAVDALLNLGKTMQKTCSAGTQCSVEMRDFSCQVSSGDFRSPFSSVIDTPAKLTTFTGLDTFLKLETILAILSSVIPSNNRCSLDLKSEVMLTFMKLKLSWSFSVLGTLFGVTPTTCKNIFTKVILLLSPIFKNCIVWPSKEEILKNIPKCFENFRRVRVVLDCTEVKMPTLKCLKCRILSYSHYKGGHTIKFMIGVTPGGLISCVSNAYGGRASDKYIFENSGLLHLLEPYHDDIMVDKGFLIRGVCENHGIGVIHPPFLRKATQFTEVDAVATSNVAKARVHVERVIERLKKFKIICETMPAPLIYLIDEIMFIIAGVTNLSSPVLADDKFVI